MTDAELGTGTRLGPYLLNRIIGSGGMGQVLEAYDTVMGRTVALKLISSTYAQDPEYRERLQREARIAGRLHDPHVVPIHGTGEIDGQLYVDMRLIHGVDLESMLRQSGPLHPAQAVSIVRQIASALDAAHAEGILHRDVKPGNIIVTADDFAYLVDFGIANSATEARLTQQGDVLGTWAYMAPERFVPETAVTPRADIYALACVLFETLTGAAPFAGERNNIVAAHMSQPIPRVSDRARVPHAVDEVMTRAMAKNPAERHYTAGEFARAAESALGVSAPRQSVAHYPQHTPLPCVTPSRLRWAAVTIAAATAVAVVVAGVGVWHLTRPTATTIDAGAPQPVDLSQLDVGRYDTEPHLFNTPTTEDQGRYLEAFRLAEGMANPYEIDDAMDFVYGTPAPDAETAATIIAGTSTPITAPVMEKYGMVSAYNVQGYSERIEDILRTPSGEVMSILVTSFPNPDVAARAAVDMEAADFDVSPENERTTIPGYPDAIAHFRPGWSSIAATMAVGRLVVSVITASYANPGIDPLKDRVQRTLDAQVPLMQDLLPAVEVGLVSLPQDPDQMLSRVFTAAETPTVGETLFTLGPRAVFICGGEVTRKRDLWAEAGVDRCANSSESMLVRAESDEAAAVLAPEWIDAATSHGVAADIAAPQGVPDAVCHEQLEEFWDGNAGLRYMCQVRFGRYVALVFSGDENDIRQRAAAQYAILVNSA